MSEVSEDEYGNIVIKKRMHRQIEEGVYGKDARNKNRRAGSIIEMHDDLNAVDEDEFDRIIEQEKADRKGKSSEKKDRRRVALQEDNS